MKLVSYLQSIGVQFGGRPLMPIPVFDETVYILPVPSDDSVKSRPKAFTILEDWAGRALLDTTEIRKERGAWCWKNQGWAKAPMNGWAKKYFPVLFNGFRICQTAPDWQGQHYTKF